MISSFLSSQVALTRSLMVAHAPAIARQTEPQTVSAQADTAISSHGSPLAQVQRLNEIRALAAEADAHYDRYAETGCLAALGDAHRVDAQLERLIAG